MSDIRTLLENYVQEKPAEYPYIREDVKLLLSDNNIEFEETKDYIRIQPKDRQEIHIYTIANAYDYRYAYYGDTGGVGKKYFWQISVDNEKNNIRTIWLKPWEWIKGSRMRNVLTSIILNACGVTGTNFNGRDTEVLEVSNQELRPFLEKNSFYGYRAASLNLGLYLTRPRNGLRAGTLLMVQTFGYPFFGAKKGKYDCEVIRASTRVGCNVRGGASKLFKYFVDNYPYLTIGKGGKNERHVEWNKCVYFVEFDHTNGNSLPQLGFDFVEYSGAGFVNVNKEDGTWFHRQPMRHKEIMEQIKRGEVYSVFNSGTKNYIFDKLKKQQLAEDENVDFTYE